MADNLEAIIQRMIDAGESEDDIIAVIKEFNSPTAAPVEQPVEEAPPVAAQQAMPISPDEPDTFGEGFRKSLVDGSALKAGAEGALGFAKGAVLDLPSSLMGSLKGIGRAIVNPGEEIPNMMSGMANLPFNIYEAAQRSGSEPEAFGRMMGQVTGQPAVTAGIPKMVPPAIRGAGVATDMAGRMGQKNLYSGMLPKIVDNQLGRTWKMAEELAGQRVSAIGRRMKNYGKSDAIEGELMPPSDSMPVSRMPDIFDHPSPRGLPESKTSFYTGEGKGPLPRFPHGDGSVFDLKGMNLDELDGGLVRRQSDTGNIIKSQYRTKGPAMSDIEGPPSVDPSLLTGEAINSSRMKPLSQADIAEAQASIRKAFSRSKQRY